MTRFAFFAVLAVLSLLAVYVHPAFAAVAFGVAGVGSTR